MGRIVLSEAMNFVLDINRHRSALDGAEPVARVDVIPARFAPLANAPAVVPPAGPAEATLGEAPPLVVKPAASQSTPATPRGFTGDLLSTVASCAGHAILVFALVYAVGTAGQPESDTDSPVEIEIIVEPTAATAPEIAPEPQIEMEAPPPVPDPVVDTPDPEPDPEPKPVAELPPEPKPEPEIDIPLPPSPPELVFDPPPPAVTPEPALPVPPPPRAEPPKIDPERERERQREIARQKRLQAIREERRQEQIEEARERARQKARQAAQQQARAAAAQRQAAQARAGSAGSAGRPAARGASGMSVSAYLAAVAGRVARNKPAGSTAAQAQGVVVVAFSVTASGSAAGIRVARSSGHGVLDQAALGAVRRASPFPPPPPGAPRSFSVPMRFNAR